ncbi:RNA polymerase sigma factor, sigma-70 family [Oceanobacillus limi]|uniref:RNA polymerase sigma factor, sigma-70 family n=1 Tax=Oceanobacillus limi TaxID=930131 RepID=A0A1I0FHD7_9BACI|nr:sigma factor-like helix-turn-helix DNA-binding protein [Oceanobacillus limi]SET57433.1 RNA polymerase sigma factor, sigma-70 family [Oceanobacillus limi]
MIDYILIPNYVDNVRNIQSQLLSEFFQSVQPIDNKIPMDAIRRLYIEDREKFIDLTDELTLRGFQFFTEKANNILPTFTLQETNNIIVTSNQDRYKKINWKRLGLSSFIDRFAVQSDLFFHHIPLDGFRYINASIDILELEDEFRHASFEIQEDPARQTVKEIAANHILEHNSTNKEPDTSRTIHEIFNENKYNSFRSYCRRNNLTFLEDITNKHLVEYKNTKGVGNRKFYMVTDKLETYGVQLEGTDVFTLENEEAFNYVVPKQSLAASLITITEAFYENKHNKFVEYCKNEGITTIDEITANHIHEYAKLPGVGTKKVETIMETLNEIADSNQLDEIEIFSTGELYPYVKDLEVSELLEVFHLSSTEAIPVMTVSELENQHIESITALNDKKLLFELSFQLNKLSSPRDTIEKVKSQLKDRELLILKLRFLKQKTLEETGEAFNVTRERIRQLEKKLVNKITSLLHGEKFPLIMRLIAKNNLFIPSDKLIQIIGTEHQDMLAMFKMKDAVLPYSEEIDSFFLESEEKSSFVEKLTGIMEELPSTFNLKDYEETVEEILETDYDLDLKKIIEKYGYHEYGTFYSLNKLKIIDVLELIFKNYIHEPFKLDDSSVEELRNLAKVHFNYQLGDSTRSIEARIRDSENILLVDRFTFQWFEPESIHSELIDQIQSYISARFEEVDVINAEEIFEAFQSKLAPYHITNKLHLYSIVKYFLADKFSIGRGNTLDIYRDNNERLNVEDRIIATIDNLGGTATRDQLEQELKWPRYKIDLAISNSNHIISWEKNTIKLLGALGLTEAEKTELIHVAKKTMENGYTTSGIIFEQILFNKKLAPIIQTKEINSTSKLASIIKSLIPTLKGQNNFLYEEDSEITSFEEVIVHEFREETTRKEIQDFILQHGYKPLMASNLLEKIIENNYFMEIDLGIFYPASNFTISKDVENQLINYIEAQMGEKDYLSLNQIEGYRSALPSIDFRWNPYLIKSILVQKGYRQIKKIHHDYRYDRILLVRADSPITTFNELVYTVLKKEYNGNFHETAIHDFLSDKGIIRQKGSGKEKVLPYEIKHRSDLIEIDSIGIVTLR